MADENDRKEREEVPNSANAKPFRLFGKVIDPSASDGSAKDEFLEHAGGSAVAIEGDERKESTRVLGIHNVERKDGFLKGSDDSVIVTEKDDSSEAAKDDFVLAIQRNEKKDHRSDVAICESIGTPIHAIDRDEKEDFSLVAATRDLISSIESNEKGLEAKPNIPPTRCDLEDRGYRGKRERYEACIWDNNKQARTGQKGARVYLGFYYSEEMAARAYDLAGLKLRGNEAKLNFPVSEYDKELEQMKNVSQEDWIEFLKSYGRHSAYLGVTRRGDGEWKAHFHKGAESADTPDIVIGVFETEEDAARAYDLAALKCLGIETKLNFPVSEYEKELKDMEGISQKDWIQLLESYRRPSAYLGVKRRVSRWEARFHRGAGTPDIVLGVFEMEKDAARAYDLAALKCFGIETKLNFPVSEYKKELKEMEGKPEENWIKLLESYRRPSAYMGVKRKVRRWR